MSNRYSLCIYARTLEGKIGLIFGVSVVVLSIPGTHMEFHIIIMFTATNNNGIGLKKQRRSNVHLRSVSQPNKKKLNMNCSFNIIG